MAIFVKDAEDKRAAYLKHTCPPISLKWKVLSPPDIT